MRLSSSAFAPDSAIPKKYSCEGDDVSPPLEWRDVPKDIKSFFVVCEDPDAPGGSFHHWAAWNIPPDTRRLDEGLPRHADQAAQALNDFGKVGYDGPLPPKGDPPHHYHFRVAALDCDRLPVPEGAKVEAVLTAARPHILDQSEVIGLYGR